MKVQEQNFSRPLKGFTLIELLVVIAIVGLLASIIVVNLNESRENAKIARSVADQMQLNMALQLYYDDMGFFPPEVNRGWDPGFAQALPNNPDTGQVLHNTHCSHCPSDWEAQVQAKWKGPYIAKFPSATSWNGEYDYNYWDSNTVRQGCNVPQGIYIGVEASNGNQNEIPLSAEQKMIVQGFDADGCINGESQMLLQKL